MEYYNYFIIFDNFAVKEVQIYFVKLWFSNFDFFKALLSLLHLLFENYK